MARLTNDGLNVQQRRMAPQEAPQTGPVPAPAPEPVEAVVELEGPEEPAGDPFVHEVASLSVDEVMDRVEAGEWDAAEVYVVEEDGKGRTTLLKALEQFAADQ